MGGYLKSAQKALKRSAQDAAMPPGRSSTGPHVGGRGVYLPSVAIHNETSRFSYVDSR